MARNQKPTVSKPLHCSFCGRSELEVSNLIVQDEASICDKCVKACTEIIARDRMEGSQDEHEGLLSPQEIKKKLDQYVIGQDEAKKILTDIEIHAREVLRLKERLNRMLAENTGRS